MHRQNPEDFLAPELESLILGEKREPWPDGKGWEWQDPDWDNVGNELGTGGSNNWAGMALGSRYWLRWSKKGWDPNVYARRYLTRSRQVFMGSEIDSAIYGWMMGDAVLAIAQKADEIHDHETYNLALDWLRNLAARCLLYYSGRAGRILAAGERSAGDFPSERVIWQDVYLDAVMDWSKPPKYEKVLNHLMPLLREVGKPLREGVSPLELLKQLGFRTMVPVRVAEWAQGKGVWIPGEAVNGNTQAVKACVEQKGVVTFAPPDRGYIGRGDRTHRRAGRSTLTEVTDSHGSRLLYRSPVYGDTAIVIARPEDRILDVEIGGPEVVRDLRHTQPDAPPPSPDAPPQPSPAKPQNKKGSWLSRLLRRLFG